MESGRVFERCIHAAYDVRTSHNYALHIMGDVPKGHRQTVVELLGKQASFAVDLEAMEECVAEVSFFRSR